MGQRKITAVSDQRDLANLFKNTLCVFTLRLYSSPQFEAKATVTPAIRAKNSPSAVFSRLGRLYLWNNFCKVLLWNNCSSRHKHTHTLYTEHHWKHDSKHIFILTLGKWKRREEATIFPAMTMGHQPQTWLAKETTHIHKHYRSKQCFTLPDINTFKYYTDTTWACVYYMLVNIKSCNPHQKQLDALCCGNTQYVSEFTLYHCSPPEDSTAPVQHNAHEYHTYVRSHTSCDNFVSL